jgi:alpha-mannosidase
MQTENLHTRSVKFKWISSGQVRQALQYEIAFASSTLKVTVALDKGSDKLDFLAECDWHEIGKRETTIPQLNFLFPFAYESLSYKYDVPYGTVVRKPQALDVPGNSWAMGLRTAEDQGKPHVMLITSNKYGFRGTDNSLAVSLIRSSFDPDPYPETGNHHRMKFAICVTQAYGESEWIESAYRWNHPLNVLSGTPHSGTLPLTARFLKVEEGTAAVSAVKAPEDSAGKMWIVRLYETNGQATVAKLQTLAPVVEVFAVDGNEHKLEDDASVQWDGHSVSIAMKAYTTRALCIRFG